MLIIGVAEFVQGRCASPMGDHAVLIGWSRNPKAGMHCSSLLGGFWSIEDCDRSEWMGDMQISLLWDVACRQTDGVVPSCLSARGLLEACVCVSVC